MANGCRSVHSHEAHGVSFIHPLVILSMKFTDESRTRSDS